TDGTYSQDFYTPDVEVNLGAPTAPALQANAVWSRTFANGLVVVNPSTTASVSATLQQSYSDLDGQPIGPGSVVLPPLSAQVLTVNSQAVFSQITWPADGVYVRGSSLSVNGTARDLTGSPITSVLFSTDGGTNYSLAAGTNIWSYLWA